MRLKLTVAYDGSPFKGWQSQPGGQTVQDMVESAIRGIASTDVRIQGSGRTDAGVHARGQVAHFDTPPGRALEPAEWRRALNANLPGTIRIMASEAVPIDFHARFSATGKQYSYRICREEVLPPLELGRAWHVFGSLNLEAMQEAAHYFEGEHDFAAFAANRGIRNEPETTVRNLRMIRIRTENSKILTIEFSGDGFLYKMVRMLTSALVRAAQNRESVAHLQTLLDQGSGGIGPGKNVKSAGCAPAYGLYLEQVFY